MNYYERLEIAPNATDQMIKTAYRRLAKQYHPDTNGGSREAELVFKQVQQAYETLSNSETRRQYDASLQRSEANTARKDIPVDTASPFERYFGFNARTNQASDSKRNTTQNGPIDTASLFNRFFGGKG
ncbi:J domain-containing protein [Cohnella terricola]|uniref:J domain-containing protein n=1 Tax=Cohnella terricola TaxID=1289167 RepID=A0A559J5I5_9BACL|nr:J domain-containing protein [Cohnella terricola]TVX95086.1 J domain-containing protein [Cohnella terricola]